MAPDTAGLLDWARQIAAELGEGGSGSYATWTASVHGAGVELKRTSDGVQLFARTEWNKPNRATISALIDWDHVPYDERAAAGQSINVSLTKAIHLGARDIAQRLLPNATRLHGLVRESQDRHERHEDKLARQVAAYTALLGGKSQARNERDRRDGRIDLPYTEEIYGQLDVSDDGSIRLDVTLDAKTARAVLALISERQKAQAGKAAA